MHQAHRYRSKHRSTTAAAVTVLLVTTAACSAAPEMAANAHPHLPPAAAADTVTALADEFLAEQLRLVPEIGTVRGLPDADHSALGDNSLAATAGWQAQQDAWFARLEQVHPDSLQGRPEWVTYGFLHEALDSDRQSRICRSELWGVSQLFGWHTMVAYLANLQPVGTPELRAAALQRFGALPGYVDHEIEKLREGVRLGYTAPRGNVERVIAQIEGLVGTAPAESPFMSIARRDGDAAFSGEVEALIEGRINPAFQHYLDYLRDEYLPRARTEVGVSALPNGTECYAAVVRGWVTLDVPAEEIHRTGLQQMEEIHAEMREIAERSFGTSDVPALLERLRTDPEFTFDTRAEIVAAAESTIERGRAAMGDWFGILPRADVIVEPYPEFEEASAPGASYLGPPEDGSRPGIYRINTYRPERQSRAPLESTAFHEAIPGHHLQIAIAQERQDAHPLTRYMGSSGFSEGWGLYAERLADEMGLYSGDVARLGMLSNDAWRAARLVVDPGIHVLGWSRQQAIDYMLANTAESADAVATEIDRYVIMPGQATGYMLGRLEIQRLRADAEAALGDRFDIREFHDRVLEDGAVTLPMLRQKIRGWIADKR